MSQRDLSNKIHQEQQLNDIYVKRIELIIIQIINSTNLNNNSDSCNCDFIYMICYFISAFILSIVCIIVNAVTLAYLLFIGCGDHGDNHCYLIFIFWLPLEMDVRSFRWNSK